MQTRPCMGLYQCARTQTSVGKKKKKKKKFISKTHEFQREIRTCGQWIADTLYTQQQPTSSGFKWCPFWGNNDFVSVQHMFVLHQNYKNKNSVQSNKQPCTESNKCYLCRSWYILGLSICVLIQSVITEGIWLCCEWGPHAHKTPTLTTNASKLFS